MFCPLSSILAHPQHKKNSEGNKILQAFYDKILFVYKAISEAMLGLWNNLING